MATRRNIRDAFYTELTNAAVTTHTITYGDASTDTITVTDDDVRLIGPNVIETLPMIVYDENYTTRQWNGVGTAPHEQTIDNQGVVTKETWREYVTATFTVWIEASSEIEKEPIYEAIRSAFGKYTTGGFNESDLHADITDIRIGEANSSDFTEQDETIRADSLEIFIDFHRDFDVTGDNIDEIALEADADTDDQTTGVNYTTT